MRKWIPRALMIIVVVLVALLGMFFFTGRERQKQSKSTDRDTIVKENVKVLTGDMNEDEMPTEVTDGRLVFKKDPKYKKGDVVVSGCITEAENGFVRRIIRVEKSKSSYIFYTEPAVLTDVFEKAHIVKRVQLTEDGMKEAMYHQVDGFSVGEETDPKFRNLSTQSEENGGGKKQSENNASDISITPNTDYMFGAGIDISDEGISISGGAGVSVWLEMNIDIDHGEIVCSMALKSEGGADLSVDFAESLQELPEPPSIEKTILKKRLPNGEFSFNGIPLVFTNELEITAEAKASIEGSMGVSFNVSFDGTQGFEYDSKTGKVEELNVANADTSGLEWKAVEVSTSASAGADAHLIVKLYGCSGIDAAIGVHGSVEGTVKLASTTESVGDIGQLDMEIGPDISGTLVAKVPVFASGLIEQPLFSVKLPSFWESHWPTEEEKQDMLNTEEQSTQDASAGDEVLTAPDSHHQEDSQNGLYVTKWGQVNRVKYPTFQFKIPKGWKITTEEIEDTSNLVRERVEMENDEGLTVSYWDFSGELGMHGHMASWSEITKAADSEFEPGIPDGTDEDYSYIGKMMVAKIHVTKQWQEPIDEDWEPTDWTFYAVLPESFAKEIDFAGLSGMLETFSFQYPHYHVFMASAPNGTFTEEQEAEVIDILKSFTTTSSIY